MPSLLDGIILALVIEKPSYGYEIHQRFVRRFGEFLSAGLTSVYDALARLEEDEYVEVAGQSGARGRPRVNFRATDRGMDDDVVRWLGHGGVSSVGSEGG